LPAVRQTPSYRRRVEKIYDRVATFVHVKDRLLNI